MKRQNKATIPTTWGQFMMIAYAKDKTENMPHLAMLHEDVDVSQPVLVRIHSECLTGDVFGSKRCDCGEQLAQSMAMIGKEGGLLIYLRQEGRGIGLINKLEAYNWQDKGLDTVEANTHLGFEADARRYEVAISILNDLNIKQVRLLTNNPTKIEALETSSIEIVERIPIIIEPHKNNLNYLKTKELRMGHLFNIT